MVSRYLFGAALGAASLFGHTHAKTTQFSEDLGKRAVNETVYNACLEIAALKKTSLLSGVDLLPLIADETHYMSSSNQASACVYTPHSAADLQGAMQIIASKRVEFAVACSGHASNQGFSSTTGIQISMTGFQDVTVSSDNSYVDIGGGISWANVYQKLASSTVNVVGGRVPGPGIGGFITGGGGYSWLTNQYGLTGDTLISADMILPNRTLATASSTSNSDLFWAIRGGGNQFGVIYNFRLKAVPRPSKIYAGLKIFGADEQDAVLAAIADFSANNKDPKAQIIPTINYFAGVPATLLLAYYDGVPTTDPFSMFNVTFQPQSFNSFIQSVPSYIQGGHRGAFNTISLQSFSPGILAQIANQSAYYGGIASDHSGFFISYDVEPFLNYQDYATDAAWPHSTGGLPLNLYFAWNDASDDAFWHKAMMDSVALLGEVAKAEGQDLSSYYLYPNYALAENPSSALYGQTNLARLAAVKKVYDPADVMGLTTFFPFE